MRRNLHERERTVNKINSRESQEKTNFKKLKIRKHYMSSEEMEQRKSDLWWVLRIMIPFLKCNFYSFFHNVIYAYTRL